MSTFKIGPKVIIINDAAFTPILFVAKKATGNQNVVEAGDDFGALYANLATSPDTQTAEGTGYSPVNTATGAEGVAQADLLRILGYGDFTGAEISRASGSKGILPQAQVSTLTFTVSSPVVGTEIVLSFEMIATQSLRSELASYFSDYKIKRTIVLPIKAGETATTLASRVVAQFASDQELPGYTPLRATSAAGVVTFTSTDPEIYFNVVASGTSIEDATSTATFAETTPGFAGRNTYRQLSALRLETVVTPYMEKSVSDQFAIKGAKYSRYEITKTIVRPDGFSGALNNEPTGVFKFILYINEVNTQAISDLTKWLNANVANREMYTATTAAAAIAAETPTTATTVDASAPFTTPIV